MKSILIQILGVHAAIRAGIISYGTGVALIQQLQDLIVVNIA
jgi:hypothetical protein